jgi:hypothetical protein
MIFQGTHIPSSLPGCSHAHSSHWFDFDNYTFIIDVSDRARVERVSSDDNTDFNFEIDAVKYCTVRAAVHARDKHLRSL